MFKYVLKQAQLIDPNLNVNQCTHIGDDFNLDYKAALEANWKSILVSEKVYPDCCSFSNCQQVESFLKSPIHGEFALKPFDSSI